MADIDLTPPTVDLKGYAGDTLLFDLNVDTPSAVTGATWAAEVRDTEPAATVAATFTVTPTAAGATLELTPVDTLTLCPAEAVSYSGKWDVQVTLPDGQVWTLAQGAIEIEGDVTRP